MTQFQQNIQDHAELLSSLSSIEPDVDAAAKAIIESLNSGGCIMLCGNGGSAADAQHIAGEFVGRFLKE